MNRILLAATLCIGIVPVANASMSDDQRRGHLDDYSYCRAYAEDRSGYESYGGEGALAPIIDGLGALALDTIGAGALGDVITGRDASGDLGRAATGSIRGIAKRGQGTTARDVERRYRTIDRLTERCLKDLNRRSRR